jgi:putative membrane protein
MPSEQRLHPASILFALGGTLKALAFPALLVLFTSSRSSSGPGRALGVPQGNWELWALVLLVPATLVAVAKYLSFRLRYDEHELVIRTGLLFRNERHVPYARIQNLDAVRNVLHRLLGVTEVRVETGGGKEPEATISVLPVDAFEEMRRRVFAARPSAQRDDTDGQVSGAAAEAGRVLLHLPLRELALHGVVENRALLFMGGLFGVLWEVGLVESLGDRLFGDRSYGRGIVRDVLAAIAAGDPLPVGRVLVAIAAVASVFVALQLASIAWTVVRLHGFTLSRVDEDLRTEFGLFTRVTGTIPLRRIQTVTVHEGPLQRAFSRVGVRVETAGGGGAGTRSGTREREWVAPILPRPALPDLLRQMLPELDLSATEWQPVHSAAFRRAVKGSIASAVAASVFAAIAAPWAGVLAAAVTLPWAVFTARQHVRHLAWAADDHVVLFRSGWIWRRLTVARVVKIQAVTVVQSPFDRRTGMGRMRVDTAGASERSHRVDVPYLPWDVALALRQRLAARAASTVFRW